MVTSERTDSIGASFTDEQRATIDRMRSELPLQARAVAVHLESGLFKQFWIVQASYEQPRALLRRVDPWLVGSLHRDAGAMSQDIRRAYVVLAYWE